MLSLFDDYPIHQTPDPVATPASSDKDVYERYWFNGYSTAGDMFFAIAVAYYPHLGIRDCAISVVIDGVQHGFHASCRAAAEPTDMTIGPFTLTIVEPMRSCRITLSDNDTDFACDLLFEGRTANIEEPRHQFGRGLRKFMDMTRFTQLGRWGGWVEFGGRRLELDASDTLGTKDRSWGHRPLAGGDRRGAPAKANEFAMFFLWAPLHFDDLCAHYQQWEDPLGRQLFGVGAFLPTYDSVASLPGVEDPAIQHMRHNEHTLTFASGTRMIAGATLAFSEIGGDVRHEIELEKIFTFRMKGIGYSHPEWGHGAWKGELEMASEQWDLAAVDETTFENQHVQHFVRARMGNRTGLGALEQNILGRYEPYGLEGFIDPPRS